ncbi:choice-of-anchor J domain-containing protein [Mariniphaga sp.]|uniref:choice-of-anchor J domain-containing protein n=1 Tax=Mariniphaga sp. TaxID=1954475 RepID=UPI0035682B9F
MKNIIKLFAFILAGSFAFTSCQEELVNPDEYRIEYDQTKAPSLGDASIVKVSAGYAVLQASADTGAVDRGFLVSESENDFSAATVISVKNDADIVELNNDGTFSLRASGLQGQKTYYFKPFAANFEGGTVLGNVQSFTTRESVVAYEISTAESSLEDWENAGFESIDKDGDGLGWDLTYYDEEAGQVTFISYSWYGEAVTPENYLVFPELTLDGVDGTVTVNVQAADPDWSAETFKVVISDAPITEDNCREAEVLYTNTLAGGDEFSATVDIPADYEGGNIYMALVHAEVTDMYAIMFLGTQLSYAK